MGKDCDKTITDVYYQHVSVLLLGHGKHKMYDCTVNKNYGFDNCDI